MRKRSIEKKKNHNDSKSSVESQGKPKTAQSNIQERSHPVEVEYYTPRHSNLISPKPLMNRPQPHSSNNLIPRNQINVLANTPGFYSNETSSSIGKKAMNFRDEIEKEREEHLQHCRNEERKLRLYYVEL